ncbi:MAG: hypothetical protein ABL949_13195 [Fimbriimonadaceae bacterium]
MPHRFSSGENHEVSQKELRLLLERIQSVDEFAAELDRNISDDHATIESICEATGLSPEAVFEMLCEIRERHAEATLADRLRKLEEPTFRVERPGHAPTDPLKSLPPLTRAGLFSSILEDVVRAARPKIRRQSESDKQHHMASTVIACVALIALLVLIVGFALNR